MAAYDSNSARVGNEVNQPSEEVASNEAGHFPTPDRMIAALERLKPWGMSDAVIDKLSRLASAARRIGMQACPKCPDASPSSTGPSDDTLFELDRKLAIVRDRVRGVALHRQAGFYLHGRPGTSKTHTVRTTLERLKTPYTYQNGHLTPIGLFELFEEHADSIIVLDDVSGIFAQPAALRILLAALGSQPGGERRVHYKRQNKSVEVIFRGGVIAISNLELHGNEVIAALKSRVQTLDYNPTDKQIIALMRHIATEGYHGGDLKLSPKECTQICDFLLLECESLAIRPDVRQLVDKAYADYLLWKSGQSETHWQDLIRSSLHETLIELKHGVDLKSSIRVPTKKEEEAAELSRLEEILDEHTDPDARLEAFVNETGKSKRTFQRRLRQLKTWRKQVPASPGPSLT